MVLCFVNLKIATYMYVAVALLSSSDTSTGLKSICSMVASLVVSTVHTLAFVSFVIVSSSLAICIVPY